MSVLTISRDGVIEQQVTLTKEATTLGRLEDNDIVLGDGSVSRHHAQIDRHGTQYTIRDLGSQNGIWVSGARVSEWELQPGVPFVLGVFSAMLEMAAAPQSVGVQPPSPYASSAKLFLLDGPVAQREFPLTLPEIQLGRSSTCHVPIDSEAVSRNHASITVQGNQYILSDLGSRNGVFVNGLRIESHSLQHGDEIQLGPARFSFSVTGEYVVPQSIPGTAPEYGAPPQAAGFAPPSPPSGFPSPSMAPPQKTSLFARIPKVVLLGGGAGILIIIVLILLLSGPPKAENPASNIGAENQQTIQRLLSEGKQYLASGDFQGALEKANAVLVPELDPKNREALDLQALAQDKLRELAAARAKAEEEAAQRAAKVQSLLAEANSAFKGDDLAGSKSIIEEARLLDAENPDVKKAYVDVLLAIAKVSIKKRDYASAYEAYETVMQVDPLNAEAKKGRESLASSEQAAKVRETRSRTLFDEAKQAIERGDSVKAYRNLNAVLEMNPHYPQAAALRSQLQALLEMKAKPLYDEGVRLYNAGQLVESMRKLSQALEIYPDHGPTAQFLSQARIKCRAEAQEAFKRGYITEGLGKYKEAMTFYQRVIDLLPDPTEEYHRKAVDRMSQLKGKMR